MLFLRQSTASQEVLLGPFLDETDGITPMTGLTIANTDLNLWKEGATSEASKNSGGATHIAAGRYYAVLDATDTGTLGKLEVNCHASGALPVRREFMVLPANVYDSLVLGSDYLDANAAQVAGAAVYAYDLVIASATSSTVTLPSAYADSSSLPDDDRHIWQALKVIGGTGIGQEVLLTTGATGARVYNVVADSMPVQLDNTSQCVVLPTWRANSERIGGTAQSSGTDIAARMDVTLSTRLATITCPDGFSTLSIADNKVAATVASGDDEDAATLVARLTNTRAGYLDNLNVGGLVASQNDVTGLSVNTRWNLLVPLQIETPDSSTQVYKIRLHLYDEQGNMEAADSTPTVTLTNAAGTNRASRISNAANPSTGVYTWDYTATAGDAEEQLVWLFTVTESSIARTIPATSYVVEYTSYRFSATDRTALQTIQTAAQAIQVKTDYLPSAVAGGTGGLVIAGSNAGIQFTSFTATNAFTVGNATFGGTLTVTGATTFTGAITATNASNDIAGIDVKKISGDSSAADNCESFFDGTGYVGTGNTIPTVTQVTTLATGAVSADAVSAAAANAIADAFLDRADAVETGLTPRGYFRMTGSAMAGVISGAGTGTMTFRNAVANSKDRIIAVVSSGNRTNITYDLT